MARTQPLSSNRYPFFNDSFMVSVKKLFASADGFFLLGVRNYLFVRSTNTSTAAFDRMRKIRTAEGGGGGVD